MFMVLMILKFRLFGKEIMRFKYFSMLIFLNGWLLKIFISIYVVNDTADLYKFSCARFLKIHPSNQNMDKNFLPKSGHIPDGYLINRPSSVV